MNPADVPQAELVSRSNFAAISLPFGTVGNRTAVLMAKALYDIVPGVELRRSAKPAMFASADLSAGDPVKTSTLYESDFIPFKPRADALCVGKAYPPGGTSTACLVTFGVGRWNKTLAVYGNRQWMPAMGGLRLKMTEPAPFQSMPVSYENAYGGPNMDEPDRLDFYPFNPVGKGYVARGLRLAGLPLPNIEHSSQSIRSWKDRPFPVGFGPVGRTWQPRLKRAGTYDQNWIKNRAPKLPQDFDEGYYNCAPEDQQIPGYLRGDEEIRVANMNPKHPNLRCRLPGVRVRCVIGRPASPRSRLEESVMNLDTLWVDMEALKVVLVWRARIAAQALGKEARLLLVDEPVGSALPLEKYRHHLESATPATTGVR